MHLRRALFLFAIVLGLAALATSVSQPRRDAQRHAPQLSHPNAPPSVAPPDTAQIRFTAGGRHERRTLVVGRHATVAVYASGLGQVEIAGLGLSAPVEPDTPARFDVLLDRPGRFEVRYLPATAVESKLVGALVGVAPRASW